ncbi:MAG: glycosyltransferase family 4 protein, partial [Patescibacteria group bacterium]
HIVGDGPYAVGLKQLAEKSGVGGRVKFFHNISDADLPEFYRNCKIFVMPSRQIGGDVEGFGIVYLEAALFGKPSVVGNVGGAPEAVLNNQTGLTVNPESPSEIAASIVKLLKDDNLRQTFGRAAKGRAEKEFNWNNQLSKIINKL